MHTIFVVDDHPTCREMISTALEKHGYKTICAADGAEALRLIEKDRPDLMLLDAQMPGIDGIGCLHALRRDARFRRLPVILLTSVSSKEFIVRISELGLQGYLLKEKLSLIDLLVRVKRCLVPDLMNPSTLPSDAA